MKSRTFLLIGISLALTACGQNSTPARSPVTPDVPQASVPTTSPDKPIEVSTGKEFNIAVQSNPSTGYHWEIMGDLDASLLEFVSKAYKADEPVLIGSGGVDILTFKAEAAGETTIKLGYYPPSNDAVQPTQTLTFKVIVK